METPNAAQDEIDHEWDICNGFFVSSLVQSPLRTPYLDASKPNFVRSTTLFSVVTDKKTDI